MTKVAVQCRCPYKHPLHQVTLPHIIMNQDIFKQKSEPKVRRWTCTCAVVIIEFFFVLSHQITLGISDINCSLNAVYFLYSLLPSSFSCFLCLTLLLLLQAGL